MMEAKIHKNPRTLTPNQLKWVKRYTIKSGDDEEFLEPPNDYHEVFEWENGWIDYTVDEEIFWVWSIYSNKPDSNLGMVEAFEITVELAKKRKCEVIEWDTSRPFEAWKRLTKNIGKLETVTRQLRLKL
tara:strand:- start:47 stop:433 length:387 start_codon:yes stop_codon:yes gene_type:complete